MARTKKIVVTQNDSNERLHEALKAVGVATSPAWDRATLIYNCEREKIWKQIKKSVVMDSFKTRYGAEQNCGDEIAHILLEYSVEEIAADNGIDLKRWKGRNPGMIRMNVGNVLRGRIRRGEYVKIGPNEFNQEAKVA